MSVFILVFLGDVLSLMFAITAGARGFKFLQVSYRYFLYLFGAFPSTPLPRASEQYSPFICNPSLLFRSPTGVAARYGPGGSFYNYD